MDLLLLRQRRTPIPIRNHHIWLVKSQLAGSKNPSLEAVTDKMVSMTSVPEHIFGRCSQQFPW